MQDVLGWACQGTVVQFLGSWHTGVGGGLGSVSSQPGYLASDFCCRPRVANLMGFVQVQGPLSPYVERKPVFLCPPHSTPDTSAYFPTPDPNLAFWDPTQLA